MLPASKIIRVKGYEVDDVPGDMYVHNINHDISYLFIAHDKAAAGYHKTVSLRIVGDGLPAQGTSLFHEDRKQDPYLRPRGCKLAYDIERIDFYRADERG